jgi:hypothetical protein
LSWRRLPMLLCGDAAHDSRWALDLQDDAPRGIARFAGE